jgi:hypothetical protein
MKALGRLRRNLNIFRRRTIANTAQKGKSKSSTVTNKSTENSIYLAKARQLAYKLAQDKGFVTSDDVVAVMGMPTSPSVIGGVFRDSRFTIVGYTPSTRKGTHGRKISVWRLKSNA